MTFIAPGTCTIAADQSGSQIFEAAPEVLQSFAVASAPELATGLPGASSAGAGRSSETLSFTTTPTASSSALT